jgi:bifunctional DNA-binding transcriptional regulator/antitoxin component of YhaV-PrlF toxin-antitoxin module
MAKTMELDCTVEVRLNGRVTLPLSIRKALRIEDGDTVHLTVSKVVPEKIAVEGSGRGNCEALSTA